MNSKKFVPIIIIAVLGIIFVFAFSSQIFFKIASNERAVIFYQFSNGLDKENVLTPGLQIKAPWNDAIVYEVSENTIEEKMDVMDKNGLSINVDVTSRFYPEYDKIGYLHETFNRQFITRLVIPEIRSTVRQVMGQYTAEEIYSTKRPEVESKIEEVAEIVLQQNNIHMSACLIRSIVLPEQIKLAIENKLKQEQEALAYKFKLDKEKAEAERKRIAADGEAIANNIVNNSLTENLLRMRGIEATLELSKSPNSKVIVVGSGKDGMPLILGNN